MKKIVAILIMVFIGALFSNSSEAKEFDINNPVYQAYQEIQVGIDIEQALIILAKETNNKVDGKRLIQEEKMNSFWFFRRNQPGKPAEHITIDYGIDSGVDNFKKVIDVKYQYQDYENNQEIEISKAWQEGRRCLEKLHNINSNGKNLFPLKLACLKKKKDEFYRIVFDRPVYGHSAEKLNRLFDLDYRRIGHNDIDRYVSEDVKQETRLTIFVIVDINRILFKAYFPSEKKKFIEALKQAINDMGLQITIREIN